MCNPIASKIMERNKISEVSSQQNQQLDENGDNDSPNSNTVSENASPNGRSSAEGSVQNDQEVDTIREYDVLMGRGSGPNRHSGNIHFRAIVGEIFDEFLSKHGADPMMGEGGTDMLRIDPSTKNRLAQTVLDKITTEKKGRFLQKLNKKELSDAIKKGDDANLIKARAFSLMDAAMASAVPNVLDNDTDKSSGEEGLAGAGKPCFNPNAIVYYRIIPEKQILAKIKQTFRFLRDQNEASNAEKHRQRARRAAAAATGTGIPRDQMAANPLGANMPLQGGLPGGLAANNSTLAATYALMERIGVNGLNPGLNPSPIPDQLGFGGRALNNIIPPTPSMTMSAIKNFNTNQPAVGAIDLASRLLCDLPQPKRILSTSEAPSGAPSLLQGSALAAAVSQLDGNNGTNKVAPGIDGSAKRLLEELTLSRLANLQKQREDTINAYLAMERSTGGTPGQAGIAAPSPAMNGLPPSSLPAQQLQRLLSLNATGAPSPMPPAAGPAALGGLPNSTSEPLSLLLQLNNNNNNARNGNPIGRAPGPLRAYNSTSF